jgi:hypothetical protein
MGVRGALAALLLAVGTASALGCVSARAAAPVRVNASLDHHARLAAQAP